MLVFVFSRCKGYYVDQRKYMLNCIFVYEFLLCYIQKGKGTFSNFPIPIYTQSDIFTVSRQTKVRLKLRRTEMI